MAEAPAESQSTGSQIPPLLRQRMLNRAATFTEGAHRPGSSRRRSSLLSDGSDTRHSFRSSSDNLLRPTGSNDMEKLTKTDEPSLWHSLPLAVAIFPALAGLLFQNGGAVVTDILLLGFASMFLNWCLRTPWEWYHSAQQVQYVQPCESHPDHTILEEDEEGEDSRDQDTEFQSEPESKDGRPEKARKDEHVPVPVSTESEDARQELHRNEMLALIACFFGPLAGAYILHAIRAQLTRPAEGLVSNFNLTIFVMAAELRPVSHLIKLKQARILHLQRIVRSDSKEEFRKADIQELSNRLVELETRVAKPVYNPDVETMKIGATVRQGMQPQLDALNRAVRRYEKRQAAQSMQVEARFQELEGRLRDALSLAAAAARTGQRPGIASMVLTWIVNFVTYGLQTSWAVATYPFRTTVAALSYVQTWFSNTGRQPRKRVKGSSSGAFSISTTRMQSRSGR